MSGIAISLARKAAAKAYGAAGKQLRLLDEALFSGQATPREVARQGNILANRRSTISGNARNTNMKEKLAKRKVAASPKINRRATAPFKASRFSGSEDPRAKVTGLARSSELKQKAAKAAVAQQFAMDRAQKAGQITDREIVRQNRILMRRRKQA